MDRSGVLILRCCAQAFVYVALIRLLVVDIGALTWAEMGLRRFDGTAVREAALGAALARRRSSLLTLPVVAILATAVPGDAVSPLPPAGETDGLRPQPRGRCDRRADR